MEGEQLYPEDARRRHAETLASVANGQLQKRGKGLFRASDFMGTDPWAEPKKPLPPTPEAVRAQVAAVNAARGKRK